MNKIDLAITIGICAIGWAAFPLIYKLVNNRRRKKENESKNGKKGVGKKTSEAENTG